MKPTDMTSKGFRALDAMRVTRRELLTMGLAASLAPSLVRAQDYPTKPIRITVGATPGGSIDNGARIIAGYLGEPLKTNVVVENKPGAAGVLNTEYVARAQPDGYTLLLGTPSPVIIAPQAMPHVKMNPLTDLKAINMVSTSPLAIVVNPKLGIRRLSDLVALSKTRPITMGLPLAGSVSHLVVEMVAKETGCNFLNVSYKGAAPALTDTIAGHIDATVGDLGVFLQMHAEGRIRIALVTSERRIDSLPDVPTANEDAPGLVVTNWLGIFAPGQTPPAIIDKLDAAIQKTVAREEVKAAFRKASATATSMPSAAQFQKFVGEEYLRFGRILRERNIVITG